MRFRTAILFLIPSLIWGSTWYAIKFQLGYVDPLVSVAYRFLLAGMLLLAYSKFRRLNLKFSLKQHALMALLGTLLFGFNYWLVYEAELLLTSGLVAIIFSLIIIANIVFNALLLKGGIRREVVIGALFGIIGTVLIFLNEFQSFNLVNNIKALVICFFGVIFASLGNIVSAYNQKRQLPVIQTNAFAMTYGSLIMFLVIVLLNKEFRFDVSFSYISSLTYLSLLGSIVAFTVYLKLLGEIGPDRSAYIALITPVIALIISTFLEDYTWELPALIGVFLLLAGNIIALKNKLLPVKTKI